MLDKLNTARYIMQHVGIFAAEFFLLQVSDLVHG